MKRFLQIFLFFISLSSFSQILDPVKWEFGSTNISGDEYELIFVAKIDTHWSLYSQFVDEGDHCQQYFYLSHLQIMN